jgi:phospholipid/cholesterol/gamma-HCH transport system ATP-binding protein
MPGEIFVIVGGSGCGKSVLLRQIIGLEQPAEGQVIIDGQDFGATTGEARRQILRKFGVMFQSNGLFASMTLAENIELVLEEYTHLNSSERDEVIEMNLRSVGLGGFRNFTPAEVSGGMRKRAALARAMALNPSILCFDEPSSGLDPVTAASLDKLIKNLNSVLGATMIVVTHDLESIMSISDRILMLDTKVKGILATGTAEELKNYTKDPNVFNFFNRIA